MKGREFSLRATARTRLRAANRAPNPEDSHASSAPQKRGARGLSGTPPRDLLPDLGETLRPLLPRMVREAPHGGRVKPPDKDEEKAGFFLYEYLPAAEE